MAALSQAGGSGQLHSLGPLGSLGRTPASCVVSCCGLCVVGLDSSPNTLPGIEGCRSLALQPGLRAPDDRAFS